jgi:hypothetical protein
MRPEAKVCDDSGGAYTYVRAVGAQSDKAKEDALVSLGPMFLLMTPTMSGRFYRCLHLNQKSLTTVKKIDKSIGLTYASMGQSGQKPF